MNTQTHIQPGFSLISPNITVDNVETSVMFYQKAFNFEKKDLVPGPDGTIVHAELIYQGCTLMLGKMGAFGSPTKTPKISGIPSPIILYVYAEDVDHFYKNAVAAGAKSLQAPEDMFWGDRMCSLEDIDGYVWNFATHIGEMNIATAQI